jgi:hypothetical protein
MSYGNLTKEEKDAIIEVLEEKSRNFDDMLIVSYSHYDYLNKNLKIAIEKLKKKKW